MKIGIEINTVIRDINSQMLKYYIKDIDKHFDDSLIDLNKISIIDDLKFPSKKAKEDFLYVDYPFEIFGCAKTSHRNISPMFNKWMDDLENERVKYDVSLFSLKENALTIQSSFHFLSKIGSRVRSVFFPKDGKNMWENFDIIITTNERIVKNKPDGKVVILIQTSDNKHLFRKSDFVYASFYDFLLDKSCLKLAKKRIKKVSWFGKIKNVFRNLTV